MDLIDQLNKQYNCQQNLNMKYWYLNVPSNCIFLKKNQSMSLKRRFHKLWSINLPLIVSDELVHTIGDVSKCNSELFQYLSGNGSMEHF